MEKNDKKPVKTVNIIKKIKQTKQNFSLLFEKFSYYRNNGLSLNHIKKLLDINYITILKYERKLKMIDKIHKVTIDRALRELIFKSENEIRLFNFLIKDLNFWKTYEQVTKQIPISRYFFNRVREYILEEVNNFKD